MMRYRSRFHPFLLVALLLLLVAGGGVDGASNWSSPVDVVRGPPADFGRLSESINNLGKKSTIAMAKKMEAEEHEKNRAGSKASQDQRERHERCESLRSRIAELKGEKHRLVLDVTKELKKSRKDDEVINFMKEQL
jgi:hypothetical protein